MDLNADFIYQCRKSHKTQMYAHKNFIGLFVRDEKELTQFSLKRRTFYYYFYLQLQVVSLPRSLYFSFNCLWEGILSQITKTGFSLD